jgi:hypothetical protein
MNLSIRPSAAAIGAGGARRWITRIVLGAGLLTTGLATSAQAAHPVHSHHPYSVQIQHRTLLITGNAASSKLALRLRRHHSHTLQVDVGDDASADFSVRRRAFDRIVVNAGGGNDAIRIDESNGAFTTTKPTQINGQGGNDTLTGGSGNEVLNGGSGDDLVDGNAGADRINLGSGNDRFVWDPGDGSDTLNGGSGHDAMTFNGSAAAEQFRLSANRSHTRFTSAPSTTTWRRSSAAPPPVLEPRRRS